MEKPQKTLTTDNNEINKPFTDEKSNILKNKTIKLQQRLAIISNNLNLCLLIHFK
ncbi:MULTISPECIES: hypothetical protein [unclassified Colwellia]|uniref:hypothetical protein n=1 Tax=unclassified Colwellia TaxID=196834 RepID=UPI0015F70C5C|nr:MULTISPECIES: hypothetical protein [unclassified Colwellia]MBA6256142.1 hypothetical protein [Colwellia sp. MB3u-28]MBA6260026.1 hypothetical protein [Colwellia sp. MB3u-41]